MYRLRNLFEIGGLALDWITSYLSGRKQSVQLGSASSTARDLEYGVPQGSALGPILFTLYTSPIHDIMCAHGVKSHAYADDTQGYLAFKPSDDGSDQVSATSRMVDCILAIDRWLGENMLKNNIDKLVCIFLNSSSVDAKLLSIHHSSLRGHHSEAVRLHKESGCCSRSPPLYGVSCGRCLQESALSASVHRPDPKGDRRVYTCNTLVCSLVFNHIDYCNSLLCGVPRHLIERFQHVQNSAARLVLRRSPPS